MSTRSITSAVKAARLLSPRPPPTPYGPQTKLAKLAKPSHSRAEGGGRNKKLTFEQTEIAAGWVITKNEKKEDVHIQDYHEKKEDEFRRLDDAAVCWKLPQGLRF